MICPCKICEEKGCGKKHDSCESYRKWSAERTEVNRRKKMETEQSQLSRQQEVKHWRNLKQGRTVSRR